MNVDQIHKLQVAKLKCDNSLMYFTRYFFMILKGTKFIQNHHHHTICHEIQELEDYKTIFLNINIPPRFSKTEIAAINKIARGLGKNPRGNYLYITSSDELRSEVSVRIRDIVTCPEFKLMYGIELKKDQNSKNLWRTKQGGGLKTATIFGQITGFGAGQMIKHDDFDELVDYIRDFEGDITLDDINKINDVVSLNVNNKKVISILFNTILSRKNSKDTPITNIQQRIGVNDATDVLLNYYKKSEKVVSLVMPVIVDGVPLWEWKLGKKEIEELRTSPDTSSTFQAQYMQDPLPPEGLLFPREELNYFTMKEFNTMHVDTKIAAIDPADDGTDHLSFPMGEMVGKGIYITDVMFTQDNLEKTTPLMILKINEDKINHVYIETNSHGKGLGVNIRNGCTLTNSFFKFSVAHKPTRMINQQGFVIKHFFFRSDIDPNSVYGRFMHQLTRYMKGESKKEDDAPDSICMLSWFIQMLMPHVYKVK